MPPPPPPSSTSSTFYGVFTYVFIWRCIWTSIYLRKVTSFCCRQPAAVPQVVAPSVARCGCEKEGERVFTVCIRLIFLLLIFCFFWVSLRSIFYTDFSQRMIRGHFKLNPVSLLNSCHRIEILFMQFMSYSQEMNFWQQKRTNSAIASINCFYRLSMNLIEAQRFYKYYYGMCRNMISANECTEIYGIIFIQHWYFHKSRTFIID